MNYTVKNRENTANGEIIVTIDTPYTEADYPDLSDVEGDIFDGLIRYYGYIGLVNGRSSPMNIILHGHLYSDDPAYWGGPSEERAQFRRIALERITSEGVLTYGPVDFLIRGGRWAVKVRWFRDPF